MTVRPLEMLKGGKVTTFTNNLIESGHGECPHLAVNGFVCVSIAREAGLRTPDFLLSNNRQLFVMRRFDRAADGAPLGFEDFAGLTGHTPLQKYEGSYEMVAEAIRACPAHCTSGAPCESSSEAWRCRASSATATPTSRTSGLPMPGQAAAACSSAQPSTSSTP